MTGAHARMTRRSDGAPRPARAAPARASCAWRGSRQAGREAGAEAAARAVAGGGRPLPAPVRAYFEPRLGRDLGGVRVHTGAAAARAARLVEAHAFSVGEDIVFATGRWAPDTRTGLRLLAHELGHVVRQSETGELALQRQPAGAGGAGSEEDDPGKVVVGGLQTVAEQAVDNNPKVKSKVVEPLEREAKRRWGELSGSEQGAVVGFGAGTLGMTGAAMLGDPHGRQLLSGVNLATPFQLIPHMPLTDFRYVLPEQGSQLLRFRTGFAGDDLLTSALRRGVPGMPPLSLRVGMDWGWDSRSRQLSITGAQATLGIWSGLSLSGGTFTQLPALPETHVGPEGGLVETRQRLPGTAPGPATPGFQVMLSLDLMRLDRSVLPRGLLQALGRR
jgi:hypothetical protein